LLRFKRRLSLIRRLSPGSLFEREIESIAFMVAALLE
jgi:hypothetical protein